ncbi:MAG: hypothetical protein EBS00_07055 [Verrucomicrobia bacterium]|nr:hypothetical protein [Verrucomicrobiota bacterium]
MPEARQKRFAELLQPQSRILILAPHPDDECLGTGGLIQKALSQDCQVSVIFITNGDNNPWPQRYVERRWSIGPAERKRWGERRQGEAQASLSILGRGQVNAEFLGLPDAGIQALWQKRDPQLIEKLRQAFIHFQPTLVVMPSVLDRHTDHRATHAFGLAALEAASCDPEVLTYLIHRPWLMKFTGRPKAHIGLQLSNDQRLTKLKAIECHQTQMALSRRRFCGFATLTEPYNFYY